MNFIQNMFNDLVGNARFAIFGAIVIAGVYFGFKRKWLELGGAVAALLVAVGFVYGYEELANKMAELFKKWMA